MEKDQMLSITVHDDDDYDEDDPDDEDGFKVKFMGDEVSWGEKGFELKRRVL